MFFQELDWQDDKMIIGDLTFRLAHYCRNEEIDEDCFYFYKLKGLVDQYEKFFSLNSTFQPKSILELGMWDGGSVAFWNECFKPEMHVGIDLMQRQDSKYFTQYATKKNLLNKIKTYWGVDQADSQVITKMIHNDFGGSIDLIIDDASHLYELTKASFEILFPYLTKGGIYIIEDWAWGHWQDYQSPDHPWADQTELTQLVFDLIELIGSTEGIINNLYVSQGFIAIERGNNDIDTTRMALDSLIVKRQTNIKLPAAQESELIKNCYTTSSVYSKFHKFICQLR